MNSTPSCFNGCDWATWSQRLRIHHFAMKRANFWKGFSIHKTQPMNRESITMRLFRLVRALFGICAKPHKINKSSYSHQVESRKRSLLVVQKMSSKQCEKARKTRVSSASGNCILMFLFRHCNKAFLRLILESFLLLSHRDPRKKHK